MLSNNLKVYPRGLIIVSIVAIAAIVRVIALHKESLTSSDEDIAGIVNDWIGRTLNLPDTVGWFTTDGNSINACSPIENFKIVRYIGKEGCTSCRLHLNRYPEILRILEDSAKCDVEFVCIVNPADGNELRRILYRENYAGLTIWIDETDTLNKINQFPQIEKLQTFLLDKNNKVLAIGDRNRRPRD